MSYIGRVQTRGPGLLRDWTDVLIDYFGRVPRVSGLVTHWADSRLGRARHMVQGWTDVLIDDTRPSCPCIGVNYN